MTGGDFTVSAAAASSPAGGDNLFYDPCAARGPHTLAELVDAATDDDASDAGSDVADLRSIDATHAIRTGYFY